MVRLSNAGSSCTKVYLRVAKNSPHRLCQRAQYASTNLQVYIQQALFGRLPAWTKKKLRIIAFLNAYSSSKRSMSNHRPTSGLSVSIIKNHVCDGSSQRGKVLSVNKIIRTTVTFRSIQQIAFTGQIVQLLLSPVKRASFSWLRRACWRVF